MTNSDTGIREFAKKVASIVNGYVCAYYPFEEYTKKLTALISEHYVSREEYDEEKKSNSLLHKAMVTAEKGGHDKAMEEISEHYYPKEKYDKLLQQRDELLKIMKSIYCTTDASDQTSLQHAIYRIGAAIKNTER